MVLVEGATVYTGILLAGIRVRDVVKVQVSFVIVLPIEVTVYIRLPWTYLAAKSFLVFLVKHVPFGEQALRHHQEPSVGCKLRTGEGVLVRLGLDQLRVALHLETKKCAHRVERPAAQVYHVWFLYLQFCPSRAESCRHAKSTLLVAGVVFTGGIHLDIEVVKLIKELLLLFVFLLVRCLLEVLAVFSPDDATDVPLIGGSDYCAVFKPCECKYAFFGIEVHASARKLTHLVPFDFACSHDDLICVHGFIAVNHLCGILVHFHHKDSRLEVGAFGKRHVAFIERNRSGGRRVWV